MPKRNLAYMAGQREMIARAARERMVENGLHRTSIRDICVSAGVSIGAFYNHFKDRNEVVAAACAIDFQGLVDTPVPTCWKDYLDGFRELPKALKDQRVLDRIRLGYEFVAELTQVKANPTGLDAIIEIIKPQYREPLAHALAAGEITLPLGLEKTADLHARLYWGTIHWLLCNRDADPVKAMDDLIEGMGVLAGLTTGTIAPPSRHAETRLETQ
jgi:AcrR family transcriptional regulator